MSVALQICPAENADTLRVLLIDDDQVYLTILTKILCKDETYIYDITTANSGDDAIECFRQTQFDLIIIDYNLPDMTGIECLSAIRSGVTTVAGMPPAIICTADGNEKTATAAIRADADDYLAKKDIGLKSLHRAINNAVTKHRLQCASERHNLEVRALNKKLERQNREIRQFYHNVSHEVKTPLAAAREFVALVKDAVPGPINTEQDEILTLALASCDQIAQHFNDLTDIARLDLGGFTLDRKTVSVATIIERSLAACALNLRERGGTTTVQHDDVSVIHADENRVVQVLSNLVSNAIKYSDAAPKIDITVTKHNNQVRFAIRDQGRGISDEDHEKIFERLHKAHDSANDCLGAGLGLGLSIAREIVNLHGGEIWMESEPDVGSTFYFTVPR